MKLLLLTSLVTLTLSCGVKGPPKPPLVDTPKTMDKIEDAQKRKEEDKKKKDQAQ